MSLRKNDIKETLVVEIHFSKRFVDNYNGYEGFRQGIERFMMYDLPERLVILQDYPTVFKKPKSTLYSLLQARTEIPSSRLFGYLYEIDYDREIAVIRISDTSEISKFAIDDPRRPLALDRASVDANYWVGSPFEASGTPICLSLYTNLDKGDES